MRLVAQTYSLNSVRKQKTYTKDDVFKTQILFRALFLVALVAILSLFYIWSRVQIVHYGYVINSLKSHQEVLLEQNKKLGVEWATLKSPERIEKIARDRLLMQSPTEDQIRPLK